MEFDVKGITFNIDELTLINVSEIKTETISRSHIFHLFPNKKRAMLLLRAGDFVEPSFVTKYLDKGVESLYQLELITDDEIDFFELNWKQLRQAKSEQQKRLIRDRFMKQFSHDYQQEKDKSILGFVVSCFDEFYNLPPHILNHLQDQSMLLYTRSLLISAVSSITAMSNNILDYDFIKDLYNVSFVMDYGLVESGNFNYALSTACEKERNTPGEGVIYLEDSNRPEIELQTFIQHPNISYSALEEYQEYFIYPELLDFIKLSHEKSDGSGFPNGYTYSAMSHCETLLSFCDYLIPFQEHLFKKGDGNKVLNEYFSNLKNMKNIKKIPIHKVIQNWESMMNWAQSSREEAS